MSPNAGHAALRHSRTIQGFLKASGGAARPGAATDGRVGAPAKGKPAFRLDEWWAAVWRLDFVPGLARVASRAALRVAPAALPAVLPAVFLLAPAGAAGTEAGKAAGARARGAQGTPAAAVGVRRAAPATARRAAPAPDPAELRRHLLAAINRERERAGVVPLAPSGPLDRVAQERAEEIGKAERLPGEEESFLLFAAVQRRIRQAGYHPHGWTESMTGSVGEVADVIAYWKEDASFSDAMGADYRDLGIGIAELGGVPFYTFLFAWPERDFFARQTAPLADLAAVRDAMLAAVNEARRTAGLAPLVLDDRLNAAAQEHAQDMLARAYYSHWSPDGASPRTRVLAAGYLPQTVAENIAEGEFTVNGVMSGWMNSSGHRSNILGGAFRHLGVGLAVGRFEDRYRLLWVQAFGKPAAAPSTAAAVSGQPR
jgi:uncharacterized protein YkwD